MADVLVLGNLQLDILCRTVTELPPSGGIRHIDNIDFVLSGNGGNVVMALARMGVSVELAATSGADAIAAQFRAQLAAEGVGVDKLRSHATANTGTSVIALAPGGERSILFVNGANDATSLDDVPDSWLSSTRIVVVTTVFVLPRFTGPSIAGLFRRAHAAGARTLLNVCWDNEARGLPFLSPALDATDYLVLNHDEGRQLTGLEAPERILGALGEHTAGSVVLTLGGGGCCLETEDGVRYVPALEVDAVDCTGAGDSFVAGFVAGLMRGLAPEDCARLGCQIAAFAVSGPGAYVRIPREKELP